MGCILSKQDNHIQLGAIQGVFGIKGWLKIFSYCRPKEQILNYQQWELRVSNDASHYDLQEGKVHGNGIVAKLENIDDRSQAEELIGSEIWLAKENLPVLLNDEVYWYQLEGLDVINLEGELLGYVNKMLETGANDVMVVRNRTDKQEILIPYIYEQVIRNVDLEKKLITVDWQKDY